MRRCFCYLSPLKRANSGCWWTMIYPTGQRQLALPFSSKPWRVHKKTSVFAVTNVSWRYSLKKSFWAYLTNNFLYFQMFPLHHAPSLALLPGLFLALPCGLRCQSRASRKPSIHFNYAVLQRGRMQGILNVTLPYNVQVADNLDGRFP